ncbi:MULTISPECIES: hypothetical protein [unclassified Pseudomonas]|nr:MULTISPECIES: hypothetical protein [unclassified Pseudomonas]
MTPARLGGCVPVLNWLDEARLALSTTRHPKGTNYAVRDTNFR